MNEEEEIKKVTNSISPITLKDLHNFSSINLKVIILEREVRFKKMQDDYNKNVAQDSKNKFKIEKLTCALKQDTDWNEMVSLKKELKRYREKLQSFKRLFEGIKG